MTPGAGCPPFDLDDLADRIASGQIDPVALADTLTPAQKRAIARRLLGVADEAERVTRTEQASSGGE